MIPSSWQIDRIIGINFHWFDSTKDPIESNTEGSEINFRFSNEIFSRVSRFRFRFTRVTSMAAIRSISRQRQERYVAGRRALYDPLDESKEAARRGRGGKDFFHSGFSRRQLPPLPDETCTPAKRVLVKGDACIEFTSEEDSNRDSSHKEATNSWKPCSVEWLINGNTFIVYCTRICKNLRMKVKVGS